MRPLKQLSFKVGDLLTLDESYVKEHGKNLAWLVVKITPIVFHFIDLYGYLEGVQISNATEWHHAWRVIPGEEEAK